jgi:PAS domain S-box-containing protein
MEHTEDQKKLHEALNQARSYQARLESILDNIVDGLITIDERGAVQSFNKACEKMFGYEAAEVIGYNINMLMPAPYAENHDRYLQNYRETGHAKIIGIGREVEAKRKDGTVFPIDLSVAEVWIGSQRLFSGIIRDISERKAAEKYVGLLAAIVQSSEDAIISKALDGIITSWNAGAEKLFGYKATEAIGQHISIIIPSDRLPEESYIIGQLRKGKSIEHFDTVRRHKDGREIQISLTESPIFDAAGNIIGASKMARDLTERKMYDEQLRQTQKMEAVGQLTSGVAHDFNNLLTVVLGNTRLIRKRMKQEGSLPVFTDITERIDDIDVAAQRGADLVRRLMVFTRQRPMQKTVVHVNSCIQDTSGLLARAVSERIEIKSVLGENVWPVHIDQDQFVNGLINMAVNARDAMPHGGVLTIKTANVVLDEKNASHHPALTPGRYVMISISDTGTGMTEEVRRRIFEPFFTTKAAGEGTGLGLSMIYGLIQQSGGHIEVDSEIGRGTEFRIYLPGQADADGDGV